MNEYYIIYQTTNLINNKIYIGCHITKNLDDGYLGSGTMLISALKKYGRENFKREILFECESVEELREKEREIVNIEFISRDDNYNIQLGGNADNRKDRSKPEDLKERLRGRQWTEEQRNNKKGKVPVKDKDGRKFTVMNTDVRYLSGELIHTSTGTKRNEETKQLIGMKAKNRRKCRTCHVKSGLIIPISANQNFFGVRMPNEPIVFSEQHRRNLSKNKTGKRWITSPDLFTIKQVSEDRLEEFLLLGWQLGYKHYKKDISKKKTI